VCRRTEQAPDSVYTDLSIYKKQEITIMNYLKPVLVAAVLSCTLAACDSKQENKREAVLEKKADILEKKADIARDQGEAKADRIEKADPGIESKATDRAAGAARDTSERQADQLENEADRVREKK
jgi:hypothetical protein